MPKRFIEEQELLEDSYRLALQIDADGFRPNFIVGVWRGGSTVGIYVQECLQYLGVETDHIAIRTSYRGRDDYLRQLQQGNPVRAHGLQYLFENLAADDRLLLVDDEVRVAAPYFRAAHRDARPGPDYYLQRCDEWLVLPYELTGLTRDEIEAGKPWILPLLDELRPGWN